MFARQRPPGAQRRGSSRRLRTALGVLAMAGVAALPASAAGPGWRGGTDWRVGGHDPGDTRSQPFETALSPATVGGLTPKWVVTTAGDVSATPAVSGGSVYFPDWGGKLWRVDAATGAVEWSSSIAGYTGVPGSFSRSSPAVDAGVVYVGDQSGSHLMAISARTGKLRWIRALDLNRWSILTSSPVVVGQLVLVGISSRENLQSEDPCCSFRGSVVALDKHTGGVVWQHFMLPDNGGAPGGFAGAGIVNPPAVDVARGIVYVGTNSQNSVPASVAACLGATEINGEPPDLITHWSESCFPADDLFSSVVALDLHTGALRWSHRVAGTEAWQVACGGLPPSVTWCANPLDLTQWDVLGSGANVFRTQVDGHWRRVVGIGSRTGIYRLFDGGTGELLWTTLVGPQFGIQWGTATDGRRIYVSIADPMAIPYQLQPSGTPTTGGSWAALDPATGRILWQVPVPDGANALGPPTVANGVVYGGSMAPAGDQMYALDAVTGAILWTYASGGSVNAGAAVSDGSVYWGSGYVRGGGTPNNRLYGFSLPGPG
jgi:polyvinyl alcohol dehydrogenase (cytochrome)